MSEFKKYMRKGLSEMRPYVQGEDISHVSVADVDTPSVGGMIARNPKNHDDQWYVAAEYFADNLTEIIPNFEFALIQLKQGKRVARSGWNGKGMFLFLVQGSTFQVNRAPLNQFYEEGTEVNYHAHIDMRTADGTIVPWLASQTDMLAEDWEVVE